MSWEELNGSPSEAFSESGGIAAKRIFLVPWETRFTQADALVGVLYPVLSHCRVVDMQIVPWGGGEIPPDNVEVLPGTGVNNYSGKQAQITVTYGTDFTQKQWPFPKPAFRAGTELRVQTTGGGQFLTVPGAGIEWEDDSNAPIPADVNNVVFVSTTTAQLRWDFVDNVPTDRLNDLKGKVNQTTFLGAAPETLLFESWSLDEGFKASPSNIHTNSVSVRLLERRINGPGIEVYGWNHDYRENPAGWAKMLLSNGQPRYQVEDFTGMFA